MLFIQSELRPVKTALFLISRNLVPKSPPEQLFNQFPIIAISYKNSIFEYLLLHWLQQKLDIQPIGVVDLKQKI